MQLAVHLENGQRTYFTEENAAEIAMNPKDTTLIVLLNCAATTCSLRHSSTPRFLPTMFGLEIRGFEEKRVRTLKGGQE